jgi:hypothetical protein
MHVAVAAGVAAVGLFGPGEYARFRPWGSGHDVVHLGLTCNPCSQYCLFGEAAASGDIRGTGQGRPRKNSRLRARDERRPMMNELEKKLQP